MSYILDALKKAEAERRQGGSGAAFSGHSSGPVTAPAPSAWRQPWPWLAMTVVASLGIGLAWYRTAPPSPSLPPSQEARQAPQAGASSVPPASSAPSAPSAPSVPPLAQAPASTAAPAAPAASTPEPAREAATKEVKEAKEGKESEAREAQPKAEAKAGAPKEDARPKPAKRKEAARPAPREEAKPVIAPAPTLRELPEDIQRQVPQYAINGYIYSGSKADRSVLINGRLLHEGDEIAPGLKLESMTPKGMILNFNGTRYRTGY
jgi:general secretion pathway protein B